MENHCDWNGPLTVPDQSVQFSLVLPHEDSSYVDVYVHNPTSWLSGWSIQLARGHFTEMTPLFDTTGYAHLFHFDANGFAFGVAMEDSLIHKSTLPQPLIRFHFEWRLEKSLCLLEAAEVTNEDRHNVAATGGWLHHPGNLLPGRRQRQWHPGRR